MPYSVEHYFQRSVGGFVNKETEHLFGATGQEVTATAKTYEGMAEDTENESRRPTGKVTANGALVLQLYYLPQRYTVTLDTQGGTQLGAIEVVYGTLFGQLPTPTKSGAMFDGWWLDGAEIAANTQVWDLGGGVTLTAHWQTQAVTPGGGGGGGVAATHTITAEADTGAAIAPAGRISVTDGNTQEFAIQVEDGYVMTDVLVDGQSVGRVNSYTFKAVDANHAITAKTAKLAALLTEERTPYIHGYPDSTVRPDGQITRAEAATIFYRLLTPEAMDKFEATTPAFSDMASAWSKDAVATLSNLGILTGYPDGTFRPNAPVSRAEFAALAARFGELTASNCSYPDVPAEFWAFDLIAAATGNGWLSGYPDGTFRPFGQITRAEAVKIINALLSRTPDETPLPNGNPYSDLPETHWAYAEIQEAAAE